LLTLLLPSTYFPPQQIQRAREESEITRQDAEDEAKRLRALEDEFGDDPNQPQCKYTIKNPERVLVRLKVEHTGFTTLNNQRFGSQFVGQVANPSDILLFHKRRGGESAKGGKAAASRKKRSTAGLDVPVEPEDLEQINIEDLIVQNLANNEKKLELLDEKSMGEALEQYVDKKEARAIATMAEKMLNLSQKTLMKRARAGAENGDGGGVQFVARHECAFDVVSDAMPSFLEEVSEQAMGYLRDHGYGSLIYMVRVTAQDHCAILFGLISLQSIGVMLTCRCLIM
jgi:hypothetical protein